jgi:choline-sulfatase
MARTSGRPNILFIMTDQQRWDAMGCAGSAFLRTPNLDALARDGLMFDHHFTVWPICTPARASIWTGVYPSSHGVTANVYGVPDAFTSVAKVKTTIFELLKRGGYRTSYIGKWHLGEESPGHIDQWEGFNSFGGHWEGGLQASQGGRYKPDLETDSGVALIEARADEAVPFFHVQSYYPPHDPYTAPPADSEFYRQQHIPHPGYFGHITAIDRNIGRLMDALRRSGQLDNTVVMFTSDHGDTFGFRFGGTHKVVCFDDAIRVPLIISAPGQATRGQVNHNFTGIQDLVPTILEIGGVPAPDYLQGKSLMPFVAGESPEWRTSYYVQNRHHPHLIRSTKRLYKAWPQRALRTADWKLILAEGGPIQLYNLRDDPDELLNIFPVPRNDEQGQFLHYAPTEAIVVELARELRAHAVAIGDELGVALADKTITDPHYNDGWVELGTPVAP